MINITLYTKTINDKVHNSTFEKHFVIYKDSTFEALVSKDAKAELTVAMNKQKLEYPIIVALDEEDYFIKKVHYTRNDGTKGVKDRVTILGFEELAQAKFEKRTLDMAVEEREAQDNN